MTEPTASTTSNVKGLLYPAFQKFYSALNSLEKFEKGTNFFDNISALDNFFSEYRNITFVIQKSIAHTQFKSAYQELRDKYLANDICKWFQNKRNEVLKEQPFDLEKKIRIVIYSANGNLMLPELIYTIENDVEYSTLINSLKSSLLAVDPIEVMFSAEFSFFERGHSQDLYSNFIQGIDYMKLFMNSLKQAINETCKLSDELQVKIEKLHFHHLPKNMLFTDDYLYHCKKNYFEKASRVEMGVLPVQEKVPVSNLLEKFPGSTDLFECFVFFHIVIFQMQKRMMPTCLIVYDDSTMQFASFDSSIKTTTYRKLQEIAGRIEAEGIIQVFYMAEMYNYDDFSKFQGMESRERIKHASYESLIFFSINQELSTNSYSFDTRRIDDMKYTIQVMVEQKNPVTELSFLNPIRLEFERLKALK